MTRMAFGLRFGSALLVAAVMGCGACGGGGETTPEDIQPIAPREKIVIGRVPSGNVLDISERMEPLIAYLQKELGIDVQIKFAADYSEFTRRMEENEYDLAFCASFQYVTAHERSGYEAAVRPVRNNADTYVGIFITTRPDITSLEQLRGKRIAFVDPRSTAGYLFPLGLLVKAGVAPREIQPFFLKGHDNVVLNILNRNYDAGACFKTAETLYGKDRSNEIRIIAETDPIPNEPIAISPRFRNERRELADRVIRLLLELHENPAGLAAITQYGEGVNRFVAARDEDYNTIRDYKASLPREVIEQSGQ